MTSLMGAADVDGKLPGRGRAPYLPCSARHSAASKAEMAWG